MRMKPLDRVLCLRAALVGICAFLFALRLASTPLRTQLGWALPLGIVCLLVGLTIASLLTWRGRWREGPIRRFTSAMTSA